MIEELLSPSLDQITLIQLPVCPVFSKVRVCGTFCQLPQIKPGSFLVTAVFVHRAMGLWYLPAHLLHNLSHTSGPVGNTMLMLTCYL